MKHLGVRCRERLHSPVDLPERVSPAESAQKGLRMLVESRDIECSGEGFYTIESPRSTVIRGVGGDEIGYWSTISSRKRRGGPTYADARGDSQSLKRGRRPDGPRSTRRPRARL